MLFFLDSLVDTVIAEKQYLLSNNIFPSSQCSQNSILGNTEVHHKLTKALWIRKSVMLNKLLWKAAHPTLSVLLYNARFKGVVLPDKILSSCRATGRPNRSGQCSLCSGKHPTFPQKSSATHTDSIAHCSSSAKGILPSQSQKDSLKVESRKPLPLLIRPFTALPTC